MILKVSLKAFSMTSKKYMYENKRVNITSYKCNLKALLQNYQHYIRNQKILISSNIIHSENKN